MIAEIQKFVKSPVDKSFGCCKVQANQIRMMRAIYGCRSRHGEERALERVSGVECGEMRSARHRLGLIPVRRTTERWGRGSTFGVTALSFGCARGKRAT
jgi:hypothetical protein